MDKLKPIKNEKLDHYIFRIGENKKEYNQSWQGISDLVLEHYNKKLSKDYIRHMVYSVKKLKDIKQIENNEIEDIAKQNYKEVIEINKDGSYSSDRLIGIENEVDLKDENFLLKVHNYDPKVWEIVSARNSIWNTQLKGGSITKLYASKINVKPRKEYHWNKEDIEKIFNNLKILNKNTKRIVSKQYEKNGKILVVPIADLHAGLLSDKFSNGNDYNLQIAEDLFFQVINDVVKNNLNKSFEKVIFVLGNDMTNSDNLSSTTTKGTPQQDSSIWFTIVNRVTKMLESGIRILGSIAPLDVIYTPSNHDLHTTFGIMQTLNAWFKDDENINVDTSPLPRKYYKYGKTILAFSHDVKVKEALKIVSTEASNMWSDSSRVIFMLAHLHQAMEYEKQGKLEILRLPTISGYSRWTNTQGYVQTERKNQAFILDYNKGIIGIQNTILDL